MSIREYAAHRKAAGLRGGNPSAVQKAIASGRIAAARDPETKRIDPEAADRLWLDSTAANAGTRPAASPGPAAPPAPADGEPIPQPADFNSDTYQRSRARREHFAAQNEQLKFQQQSGALVERAQVEREAFTVGRELRERLLVIPDRLAAVLAAETDARAVAAQLELELRQVLESVVAAQAPKPSGAN